MATNYPTLKIKATDGPLLSFLYGNPVGRLLLKPLVHPLVSTTVGSLLNSRLSKVVIPSFINKHGIQLNDYQPQKYPSFNAFFKRDVTKKARPFPTEPHQLVAPCDGKVTVFPIIGDARFDIKEVSYSLAELLNSSTLAAAFQGGDLLIIRLTPDDYHHFCYLDDGVIREYRRIAGVLHTVRPVSANQEKVYLRNSREVTVMETLHFGQVVQVEVGALLVGKIVNYQQDGPIKRFEKKGYFEFGGSTIILLFQKDQVALLPEFRLNTLEQKETIIKMGQVIGQRKEGAYA